MENLKTCYIINFYLGDRRRSTPEYETDKLSFLKKQIEYLSSVSHNLSQVVFNFNLREEDYFYISEIFKITPKKIGSANIVVSVRPNIGMSYGAWSDLFVKYQTEFDYYIFNEDDYFFVEPNWDQYLIAKYKNSPNCGYLCMHVRNPDLWNGYQKHAGHSSGIASTENLLKVYNEHNCLPHNATPTNYIKGVNAQDYREGENSQNIFSFAFIKLGMNVLDISDDYRLQFSMTEPHDPDIWRLYWWNDKDLILPAKLIFNAEHRWYSSWDLEFTQDLIYSTVEEALECFNNQISLEDLRFNKKP